MPVPRDRGNADSVLVGLCSACLGGGVAAVFLGGGLIEVNLVSVAWAGIAALYMLFAYRCLAMRIS
jgi:hypothetical protein